MMASASQTAIPLTSAEQAFCALLDGTRSVPQLVSATEGSLLGGALKPFLDGLLNNGCLSPE